MTKFTSIWTTNFISGVDQESLEKIATGKTVPPDKILQSCLPCAVHEKRGEVLPLILDQCTQDFKNLILRAISDHFEQNEWEGSARA